MAIFKGTVFYRVKDAGWTESFYIERELHDVADGDLSAYVAARLPTLPESVLCIGRRVVNVDRPRDSKLTRHLPTGVFAKGLYLPGTAASAVNLAQDAVILETRFDYKYKGRVFLRGIPDGFIVDQTFSPTVDWRTKVESHADPTSIAAVLLERPFRVRGKNKDVAGNVAIFHPINAVELLQPTTRRVGRPFGVPRGRRTTPASE